jgi:hypothetical protein
MGDHNNDNINNNDNDNNILSALKELEKLSDSILCCKIFESSISKSDKELWESILKFIIYLSIQQHILYEGSFPVIYRDFCFNMNIYSKEIFVNNTKVTIRIIFIYFPLLFVSIYLSIFTCRHLILQSKISR